MNSKPARRRIEVNLEELDRIIDRSTTAPLSESDRQKLKNALHAMAGRLIQKRSTEKTRAVLAKLGTEASTEAAESRGEEETIAPGGHGRNGAAAFLGAIRVSIPHAT